MPKTFISDEEFAAQQGPPAFIPDDDPGLVTNELARQGITGAEVKRRAAAGEPIVQSGLRRGSRGDEIRARAAGAVAGAVEGLLGAPAVVADIATAPVRAMRAGVGAVQDGGGITDAMAAAARSAVEFPASRAASAVGDRVQESLGPDQNLTVSATPDAIRLGVNVAMPGPEVAMAGSKVARVADDAAEVATDAATLSDEAAAQVRQYLKLNPDTPREARGVLFREGLSEEQRAALPVAEPKVEAPKPLPEGKLSAINNRWLTTMTTALRRSGRVGSEIATKLEVTNRDAVQMASRPVEALKALRRLSDVEKEQFVNVLDGKLSASDATERVQNLAKVHRYFLDQFGAEAERAGLMMRTPDGGVVPFKRRDNYFPHLNPEDPDAPIFLGPTEAQPGQTVGGLENVRSGEGPFLRDPVSALATYYSSAGRKLAEVKHFGADVPGAVRQYVEKSVAGGEKPEFIRDALMQALGGGPRPNSAMRGLASDLMNAQVMLKLPTAVIGNATQTVYTMAKAGFKNTAAALGDMVRSKITKDPAIMDEAIASGATLESLVNELVAGRHTDLLTRGASGVLRHSGFLGVEEFNRLLGAQSGIRTAEELSKVALGQKSLPWFGITRAKERATETLTKMGVDVDGLRATGQLTPQDKMNAGYWMSHKTQFGTRHEDLPLGWTQSPMAKVLTQFKGFSFKSARFVKDDIVAPAMKGDVAPLVRFVAAAGVVGGASETVRDTLNAKIQSLPDVDAREQFIRGIVAMALGNIVGSLYRSVEYRGAAGAAEFAAGPTLGDAYRLATATEGVAKGKDPITVLQQTVTKTVPATRMLDNQLNR